MRGKKIDSSLSLVMRKRASLKWLFYIVLMHANAHAEDLLKAPLKSGQTIALYTGAFDPIHLGHDEVMRYALSHGIDYVVVVPDSKFNRYKPFITSVKLRNLLLNFLYRNEPSILTTPLHYDDVIEYLAKADIKLVAVLGSDNFIRLLNENAVPKLKAHSWLIIPRDEDKNNPLLHNTQMLAGKPVVIADSAQLTQQGYSSTKIRTMLRHHPEFYDGFFNPSSGELPLDPTVRDFIRDFKLYQKIPDEIAESKELFGEITNAILRHVSHGESQPYKITHALQEGIESGSGNLIFFVADATGKKIMTVKAFVTHAKDQQYDAELRALEVLQHLSLRHSRPVRPLFASQKLHFNLLGMEYVEGRSLDSLLQEFNAKAGNQEAQNIKHAFYVMGTALAELHATNAGKVEEPSAAMIQKYRDVSHTVINEIERNKNLIVGADIDSATLHAKKEMLVAEILRNPGHFSYLHGDAQPGNFFINNERDGVVMIDVGGAAKYFDNDKQPIGFSAHEYFQFLSSIDLAAINYGNLSAEDIQQIKDSFEAGYHAYLEEKKIILSTQESVDFFKFYWMLRGIQSDLLSLKYATNNHQAIDRVHSKLQAILA